ncbi:MAG: TRAP transporter substrate-binding protein DctP [Ignavibacteriales bacterium]|nr:TRAP transporter substrate-binding protein DctP [Ignavibacteriales bacterium]
MKINKIIKSTLAILFLSSVLSAQEYLIKFATVAPDGSTWMNVMKEYDQAIRKESNGKLGFKIYPGGVQGDEKALLQKIRLGQLHSAGVTGNGLTTAAPVARIMDSPFLFKSYDEVDNIYTLFDNEFSKSFSDNGFVNLGWAEVGFVYIFTNTPVKVTDDLKGVKMWMWEGDPIAESAFKAIGIHPIPLSITDVLTSLQTKLIDGIYISPYAAIALQWYSKVKYMLDVPLADAAGSVIISKKKFDGMPKEMQEILLRNGKKYMQKLTQLSRQDNAKSIETLKKKGITVLSPPSEKATIAYEEQGKKARRMLAGKLFSEDLLNKVESAVIDFRNKNGKKSK